MAGRGSGSIQDRKWGAVGAANYPQYRCTKCGVEGPRMFAPGVDTTTHSRTGMAMLFCRTCVANKGFTTVSGNDFTAAGMTMQQCWAGGLNR